MTISDLKAQNLILLEVIAGSKSFGLDTPNSDTDIKGVYYLPKDVFYGLGYIPQINNETNDIVYYEIGRFIELLLKNNPNILEILATPSQHIIYKHPIMDNIKMEYFLSQLCRDTFAGYASTQIKKARGLKKKIVNPVPVEKKNLLNFCFVLKGYSSIPVTSWLIENSIDQEECGLINVPHFKDLYAVFHDKNGIFGYKGIIQKENSNEVSLSSIPKGEKEVAHITVNKDAYSNYCKEYNEYWDWVNTRNNERYNTNLQHGKNYDSKNMMHTIRLLQSAEKILTTGNLVIEVNNREELLSIKAGKKDYDELLEIAEGLLMKIEQATAFTTLPHFPDKIKVEQLLIDIRSELYK